METKKIIASIVNAQKNEELLKTVPHRRLLDLAIIYRVMEKEEDGNAFITINNIALKKLGLSEEELHTIAYKNTEEILPWESKELENMFWVVSNKERCLGAFGSFVDMNLLKSIADEMNVTQIYILPSSLHETFIVPTIHSVDYLKTVVEDANRNVLKEKDFLSDNVYIYDVDTNNISIA